MGNACFSVRLYVATPPEAAAELFKALTDVTDRLQKSLRCECVGRYMFVCACSEGLLVQTSLVSGGADVSRTPTPAAQPSIALTVSSTNASSLLKVLRIVLEVVRGRGFSVVGFYSG